MKKKVLWTDIWRTIWLTKSRFFSLWAIVFIGTAFFVGVWDSAPIMGYSVDRYNDEMNMMDFTIYSNYGFDENDLKAVQDMDEIDAAEGSYFVDVEAKQDQKVRITRIHSFDPDKQLNQFVLIDGRLPQNINECVVDKGKEISPGYEVGTTIELGRPDGDLDDFLKVNKLTVVGTVYTPYYLNEKKESSTLSNQDIDTFAYVMEDAFDLDYYLMLSATGKGLKELNSFEDEYKERSEQITEKIEDLASTQQSKRKDKIVADAIEELNDGKKEYEDGLKEFNEKIADAEQELADARKKIADGEKELADGKAELIENEQKLNEGEVTGQIAINDARKQLADAEVLLNTKAAEFEVTKKDLNDKLAQIDAAMPQIEAGIAGMEQAQQGLAMLLSGNETMEQAKAVYPNEIGGMEALVNGFGITPTNVNELKSGLATVSTTITNMIAGLATQSPDLPISYILTDPQMAAMYQMIGSSATTNGGFQTDLENWRQANVVAAQNGLDMMIVPDASPVIPQMQTLAAQLVGMGYPASNMGEVRSSVNQAITDLTSQKNELVANRQLIVNGIAEGEAQIAAGRAQIADGYAQANAGAAELEAKIVDGRVQIAEGWEKIRDAEKELEDGKIELADGEKELAEKKADGQQELDDALADILKAEQDIAELEEGEWTVLDRTLHYSSVTYKDTISQMKAIASVFPVFFLLVAALVCLTTMTRMVDEQRGQLGIMRALGYSKFDISLKYLLYAELATVTGGIIGCFVGILVFPFIIYTAWKMLYILPDMHMEIPWGLCALSVFGFMVIMGLATLFATGSDLTEVPCQLMRPKPPKTGKKILLENIRFIWDRLSFTSKVTARNITRYKKRFFMTVIGVAGCTGLLVCGFGIRDSITSLIGMQFDEIYQHDAIISFDDELSVSEIDAAVREYNNDPRIAYSELLATYNGKVVIGKKDQSVIMMVADSEEELHHIAILREREGHAPITLKDDGVVITEKLSILYDLKVGDIITLESENGLLKQVKVNDICETYINHYVYMSKAYYQEVFGTNIKDTSMLVRLAEGCSERDLQVELSNDSRVKSLSLYSGLLDNFNQMIKGLDYIVIVIIISAGALAFVVLSNLTMVNIAERTRELATLKVLGFTPHEVNMYVYKENVLLTFIGSIGGIFIGIWLHHFIMGLVEMDYVMFGRNISYYSYAISVGITLAFALIVNKVMASKLHSIQMVESLKSVE